MNYDEFERGPGGWPNLRRNIGRAIAELAIMFVVTFAISRSVSPYAGFLAVTMFYLNTVRRLWTRHPEVAALIYFQFEFWEVGLAFWPTGLVERMKEWPVRRLALALVPPAFIFPFAWLLFGFTWLFAGEFSMFFSRAPMEAAIIVALVSYVVVLKLLYFPPGWFDRPRDSN